MRLLSFSGRTAKEILRDPLNLGFGIGFPVVLLLLLSAIQANVPVSLFEIQRLAPGIAVFGLAFLTLFSATLIAKDRESAFLARLYTTPLTAADFILGYLLPILPIALAQSVICYAVAAVLGLRITVNVLYAVLLMLPGLLAVFHRRGTAVRQRDERQAGGRRLRRAVHQPVRAGACPARGSIWNWWAGRSKRLPTRCPLSMRWSWNGPR